MSFAILLPIPKPEYMDKTSISFLIVFRYDFQRNFQRSVLVR